MQVDDARCHDLTLSVDTLAGFAEVLADHCNASIRDGDTAGLRRVAEAIDNLRVFNYQIVHLSSLCRRFPARARHISPVATGVHLAPVAFFKRAGASHPFVNSQAQQCQRDRTIYSRADN
jgi:hypothetical protein